MRSSLFLLTVVLAIAGCKSNGFGAKVDNPVVGPPPPRRAGAAALQIARDRANDETDDIAFVGHIETDTDLPPDLEGNRVVATVNGAPIFEAEVLERYAESLADYKTKVSPEQHRQQCEKLIERDLRAHVERKLLAEAMRKSLKKDQQKQFDDYVKRAFKDQMEKMKADFKVTSTAELDKELQRRGTSLAMVEHQMRGKILAEQYIASRIKSGNRLSRQDLFAYYQQHLKDYEVKRRAKWQQILISRRNEEQATAKLKLLNDGRQQGRDFGELATDISDGPTSDKQGLYDWTTSGSLANQTVEEALFKLPIGEVSEIITSSDSYQVVRVLERQEAGHTPFDEVQDQIRSKLQESEHVGEIAEILKELWESATIDSRYDIKDYQPPKS